MKNRALSRQHRTPHPAGTGKVAAPVTKAKVKAGGVEATVAPEGRPQVDEVVLSKTAPVAPVNTTATPAETKRVVDAVALAIESAKTVMGDRAWGDVAAQLSRITALDKGPRRQVTIVGGGISGLVAAYELERRGHQVRVLEGNDRLGGRVFTHRNEDGTYHEFGAMRIPKSHDYTRHYIEELGLKLRKFVSNGEPNALYDIAGVTAQLSEAGEKISPHFKLSPQDAAVSDPAQIFSRVMKELIDGLTDEERASMYSTELKTEKLQRLDSISLRDFLSEKVSPDTVELIGMATTMAGSMDRAMTWHMREAMRGNTVGLEEIVGGMDLLPRGVAERLKTPIEFGTKLLGIREREDGKIELKLSKHGGEPVTEVVPTALVTLPFTVLRHVETPTFSAEKKRAIETISYESAAKVLVNTRERPWEYHNGLHGGASHWSIPAGDGADAGTLNAATYYPSDNASTASAEEREKKSHSPATLVGSYDWGPDARRIGAMSEEERGRTVVNELQHLHPELKEPGMIKGTASMVWDENPWSLGAYAAPTPGQHQLYRDVLKPEGNVHFAGEHASLDEGWIQGAIISALRAVEELVTEYQHKQLPEAS